MRQPIFKEHKVRIRHRLMHPVDERGAPLCADLVPYEIERGERIVVRHSIGQGDRSRIADPVPAQLKRPQPSVPL